MAIIKPVDQVHVAGAATAGTHRQLTRQMGLGAGGKRGRFLVADADPLDVLSLADFLQQAIERVAHHAVNSFHAGGHQRFDDNFCSAFLLHTFPSS